MASRTILIVLLLWWSIGAARGVSVMPEELAQSRQWAAARFEGSLPLRPALPGLVVLANHDAVSKNTRNGKPLRLADKEYKRGLYCHAFSKILVRLPEPGETFTALAGIDSNEQTSGGRGSVDFSVSVGGVEKFRSGVRREGMAGTAVKVDLAGAREFILQVDETPDGISCDQSDWAEAKVTLKNGRELWLADLPLQEQDVRPLFYSSPPFSFNFDGKSSAELLDLWELTRSSRALDAQRTEHALTWTDPKTGLLLRCVGVEYHDFPVVEWTLHFKNTSGADSPLIENIQALDIGL